MNRRSIILTFTLALILKTLSVWYLATITGCENPDSMIGFWSVRAGDTYSYIQPAENLLQTGSYFFLNDAGEKVYAGRMPYYGFFYLVFRLFMDADGACDALVFLHILLESMAITAASFLAFAITKSVWTYLTVFLVLVAGLNVTYWTNFIMPESLGVSFLVLFLYNYYLFTANGQRRKLIYSSVFLAGLVVLKPYYIFIYLLLVFDWMRSSGRKTLPGFKTVVVNSMIAGGILTLLLSPWIIRNYLVYHKFVPTQISLYAGINYSKAELAWRDYVTAWGGSVIHWDKNSAGCYFKPTPSIKCEYILPAKAIPPGYSGNDIENIKSEFISLIKHYDPLKDAELQQKFLALKEAVRKGDPVRYHLLSRMNLTADFLLHSGSYYLPAIPGSSCYIYLIQFPLKILQSLLYYFTLIFGFLGLIFFGYRNRFLQLLLFIVLMLILVFPNTLRLTEYRYFMYSYYLLGIGAAMVLGNLLERIGILNHLVKKMSLK